MTAATARRTAPSNVTFGAKKPDNPVPRLRCRELNRLMALRYGRKLPANDDGARFRDRMLDTLARSGEGGRQWAANFLVFRCPWMTPAACDRKINDAFAARRYWTAEALGNDLDVTEAEREKVRIRTFRAAGMTDAAMKAKRDAAEAARKRQDRLQERLEAKPRVSRPAARVDAILNILPNDGWWNVCAIVSELKRRKATVFETLDKETGSLRPAVHRAIKHGVSEGRLETRKVPGSKMSDAMEVRRGSRP